MQLFAVDSGPGASNSSAGFLSSRSSCVFVCLWAQAYVFLLFCFFRFTFYTAAS